MRKNSQLFEALADKTVLTGVKSHLLKLSQGNAKQSEVLIELSGRFGTPKAKSNECKLKLRPVCKITESLIEQIKKKKQVTGEKLSEVLLTLEMQGGSTQYLYNQARTFLFMSKEISQMYGVNLDDFNIQIMEIAEQVEEHIAILEEIKAKIEQQSPNKKETTVHHPVVRYQRPDAWNHPTAST